MRTAFGSLFALCILLAILYMVVDPSTWQARDITRNDVVAVMGLAAVGLLGFMFLTGRGFAKEPRPSKYES